MDVGKWLNGLGLGEYARAFADNDIDAQTLASLSAEDLKRSSVYASLSTLSAAGGKIQQTQIGTLD